MEHGGDLLVGREAEPVRILGCEPRQPAQAEPVDAATITKVEVDDPAWVVHGESETMLEVEDVGGQARGIVIER